MDDNACQILIFKIYNLQSYLLNNVKNHNPRTNSNKILIRIKEDLIDILIYEQNNHYHFKEFSLYVEDLKLKWDDFEKILHKNSKLEKQGEKRDIEEMQKALNDFTKSLDTLSNHVSLSIESLA